MSATSTATKTQNGGGGASGKKRTASGDDLPTVSEGKKKKKTPSRADLRWSLGAERGKGRSPLLDAA